MRIYFELLVMAVRRLVFRFAPNRVRIDMLRQDGVRIGKDCLVHTPYFSTEPYLIEIGDRVAISAGTEFVTHDAVAFIFPDRPNLTHYGRIRIGNNVFFGLNCTVLPDTTIGNDCVIGAGSVVRGVIKDGSVVMGNPAQFVMKTALLKQLLVHSKNQVDTSLMDTRQKREALCRHFGIS